MKVTKELERKIKSQIRDKYEIECDEIKRSIAVEEALYKDNMFTSLMKLTDNEAFVSLLKYIGDGDKPIEYNIERAVSKMYSYCRDSIMEEPLMKLAKLDAKITKEIENMLIEVSYGKDINDIKQAFLDFDIEF